MVTFCGDVRAQKIFKKEPHHLHLFAKEVVRVLNARDTRVINEAVHEQECRVEPRLNQYERVPIMQPRAVELLSNLQQSKRGWWKGRPQQGQDLRDVWGSYESGRATREEKEFGKA